MKTITKIALIGGLLASSLALAGPDPDTGSKKSPCHHDAHSKMKGAEGKANFLDKMTDRLKLTPEQRGSVEAVLQKSKPQITSIRERMQANRKALRELGRDGRSDGNQVKTLAQERGYLVTDLTIRRTKVRDEIREILTDTQRDQMKQMREKKHGHHNHG